MVTSNYKKIAVLDFSSNPTNIIDNTKLNYSLNFEPKTLIITISDDPDTSYYSRNIFSIVTPSQIDGRLGKIHYVRDPNTAYCTYDITSFTKNELTWKKSYGTGCYHLMITHIIAIG